VTYDWRARSAVKGEGWKERPKTRRRGGGIEKRRTAGRVEKGFDSAVERPESQRKQPSFQVRENTDRSTTVTTPGRKRQGEMVLRISNCVIQEGGTLEKSRQIVAFREVS